MKLLQLIPHGLTGRDPFSICILYPAVLFAVRASLLKSNFDGFPWNMACMGMILIRVLLPMSVEVAYVEYMGECSTRKWPERERNRMRGGTGLRVLSKTTAALQSTYTHCSFF